MGEVDEAFVQAIEHRPKPTVIEAGGIPLIDLSPLNSSLESTDVKIGVISQIRDACREWGFFQVINHGVPSDLLQTVQIVSKKFFDLPLQDRRKVGRDEVNPFGYYDTEHTKNVRDWKEVFDFTFQDPTILPSCHDENLEDLMEMRNQWPDFLPELREACEAYAEAVEKLTFKLLEAISVSLGLPAKRLNHYFKEQTSFLRLNRYPPCPFPHLALGVGRHKDATALTVLSQDDVGGLDVKRKADGEWVRVKPIPNSYIINVGDIIQVWSNGEYESAEHRVMVNSERERFSIPFFFGPSHSATIKPLEELITEENPPKYREYNWGKFFSMRTLSNFKKLDVENIQIDHFKVKD